LGPRSPYDEGVRGLIRSIWDEPRPPHPPARVWRDWVLIAVLILAAVLEGVLRPDVPWRVLSIVVTVGVLPTLLWRRTRPLLMLAIAFGATTVLSLVTGTDTPNLDVLAFVLLLVYALFRWGSGRAMILGGAIVLGRLVLYYATEPVVVGDVVGSLAVLFAVSAIGVAVRYRARARARELDQVKLVERERLARDLHDTVAHHVSAMAIRAQAGLVTAEAQQSAATDALRDIETEAGHALAEMRALVRVLRTDEPAELKPGPRIANLVQLAGPSRGGPTVDVELIGDVEGLSPPVSAVVYRLAQEAVTNARRHARHATRIAVSVAADEQTVRLRVNDDGETPAGRSPASAGYGLIGMVERVELLGGTCQAGPDPAKGWTVTAVLPRVAA
jgi:signal transduction histidine kinase